MPKSERIYHGCFTRNADGTNKLLLKGENCLFSTNNPFWKYPEGIPTGVKTRS